MVFNIDRWIDGETEKKERKKEERMKGREGEKEEGKKGGRNRRKDEKKEEKKFHSSEGPRSPSMSQLLVSKYYSPLKGTRDPCRNKWLILEKVQGESEILSCAQK